jgi:hypothetical protein
MTFELLPIIEIMRDFYQKSRNPQRFQTYLQMLQGDTKDDLILPIGAYNPMGKDHVLEKLNELQSLDAEKIIEKMLLEFNKKQKNKTPIFKVVLCLSDDLHGGWTNRYTSDYDSKFKINALVTRQFCTPIFWTSEEFDPILIKKRTQAYLYRTEHWLSNPKPKTLKEHIEQEKYVAQQIGSTAELLDMDFEKLADFYKKHTDSDNYTLIFNFFYGDKASKSLGFPCFGISEKGTGFGFAESIAQSSEGFKSSDE